MSGSAYTGEISVIIAYLRSQCSRMSESNHEEQR